MKIIEYFETENKAHWLAEIKKNDWAAGQFLYQLITKGKIQEFLGESTKIYLLVDGEKVVSFCTLSEQDDVREPAMTPWIGFVYTYPEYRGHRYVGQLIAEAEKTAKNRGDKQVYISTDKTGLYEKYGYAFHRFMKDIQGGTARIYWKSLV